MNFRSPVLGSADMQGGIWVAITTALCIGAYAIVASMAARPHGFIVFIVIFTDVTLLGRHRSWTFVLRRPAIAAPVQRGLEWHSKFHQTSDGGVST